MCFFCAIMEHIAMGMIYMCKEIWIKANAITLLGVICAITGMLLCFIGHPGFAAVLLAVSGICDGFDGYFAKKVRKPHQSSEYGVELDSLADIVCAGVFPVILSMSLGFTKWYSLIIYVLFIMCGITRLTYYNVNSSDKNFFNGVPITVSAFLIPSVYFIFRNAVESKWFMIALMAAFLILSISYVTNVKIKKPTLQERTIWSVIGFIICAVVVFLLVKGFIK